MLALPYASTTVQGQSAPEQLQDIPIASRTTVIGDTNSLVKASEGLEEGAAYVAARLAGGQVGAGCSDEF